MQIFGFPRYFHWRINDWNIQKAGRLLELSIFPVDKSFDWFRIKEMFKFNTASVQGIENLIIERLTWKSILLPQSFGNSWTESPCDGSVCVLRDPWPYNFARRPRASIARWIRGRRTISVDVQALDIESYRNDPSVPLIVVSG